MEERAKFILNELERVEQRMELFNNYRAWLLEELVKEDEDMHSEYVMEHNLRLKK